VNENFERLQKAFIKSGYPEDSLVLRRTLIKKVMDEIQRPNFSLITVIGPSRTGKTQLIKYVETQFKERLMLRLDGGIITSQADLIEQLASKIKDHSFQAKLRNLMQVFKKAEFSIIGLTLKLEANDTPTFEKISETLKQLGKFQCILVIDDFHKLPDDTMQLFLNYAKSLTDRSNEFDGLKLILIYIPTRHIRNSHTFRELGTRATVVPVTLWDEDELTRIASELLRKIQYGATGLELLASQCFGLPALMQLCCREHVSANMNSEQTLFNISRRKAEQIMETVASELWEGYCRTIYDDLVANRAQVSKELFLRGEERRGGQIRTTINEMIWLSISEMKLDIGQQHEISLDISDLHADMVNKKITYFSTKAPVDIEIITSAIEKMAAILEKKYQELSTKDWDPIFELHNDKILIYSSDFLFTLRHSREHLRRLKNR
jgi:hypothetical protein